MILIRPFTSTLMARIIFVMLAATLVLRYYFWRLFSTLPDIGLTPEYLAAVILIAVESIAIFQFFVTGFINLDPKKQPKPPEIQPKDFPTVDIFIPTYDEPVDLVKQTAIGAVNMVYPHQKLNVFICDDGGTDERINSSDPDAAEFAKSRQADLKSMCQELGVTYLTRPANINAKAGNLTSALERTISDLVVVFDADHIPSQDFLARTVGYFEDRDLFLVQTPHHFINLDPIHRNLQLPDHCPNESEMFYGHVLESLDRWNGAFFCGSAALMRRAALNSIGGISGATVTEDAETALDLHATKWKSLYLNEAMVGGLHPETFSALIGQRERWATGMLQISLLKNPFFRRGLTMQQRFCYLSSILNWFFPLTRLTFTIAPLIYLFFGVNFFQASFGEAAVYTLTYAAASLMMQNVLFKEVRWPLVSEVYEVSQSPYLIRSVFSTLISPRKAHFRVTAKDEVNDEDGVSAIHWPLTLLMIACLAGLVALVFRWINYPDTRGALSIVGFWATFNFIIVAAAWQAIFERKNLRQTPRVEVDTSATVLLPKQNATSSISAKVSDASQLGFKITILDDQVNNIKQYLAEGETLIHLKPKATHKRFGEKNISALVCRSQTEAGKLVLGCTLEPNQDLEAQRIINFLVFGESEVWRKDRIEKKQGKGLLLGFLFVIILSLRGLFSGPVKFFRYYFQSNSKQKPRNWNPDLEGIMAQNSQSDPGANEGPKEARPTPLKSSGNIMGGTLQPSGYTLAGASQAKPYLQRIMSILIVLCFPLLIPEGTYAQTILMDSLQNDSQTNILDSLQNEDQTILLDSLQDNSQKIILHSLQADDQIILMDSPQEDDQTINLDFLQEDKQPTMRELMDSGLLLDSDQWVASSGNKIRRPEKLSTQSLPVIPVKLKTKQNNMKYMLHGARYRMSGERVVSNFDLWLPKFAVAKQFQITFQNSINVLENYSKIIVELNGIKIIEQQLNSVGKEITLSSKDIEPKEGLNSVTIQLVQKHRVFCGPQASFDTWTDINLADTGFIISDLNLTNSIEAIASGINIQSLHGYLPLRVDPDLDPTLATNIASEFGPVFRQNGTGIKFKSLWDPVEDFENYFRILITNPSDDTSGFGISADGAILYRLSSIEDPIFKELEKWQSTIRSNSPKILKANQATSIFDLGYENIEDAASYGSNLIQFVLPYDWLVLDNRKATLDVSFDYSSLVTNRSIFNIKVNNETIYSKKIGENPNIQTARDMVQFNASILKGGLNQIEAEYIIPAEMPEAQCPDFPQMFVKLNRETSLLLPDTPKMYLEGLQNIMPLISRNDADILFSRSQAKNILSPEFKTILALKSLTVNTPEVLYTASNNIVDQSPLKVEIISVSDLSQIISDNNFFSINSIRNSLSLSKSSEYDKPQIQKQSTSAFQWQSVISIWERFMERPTSYKSRVNSWLENNQSQVAVLKPNSDRNEIFIVINPDLVSQSAFDALSKANLETFGPAGALSVLGSDNVWHSWDRPSPSLPILLEPLNLDNFWLVGSNIISIYAAEFFVLVIILVAIIVLITFLYLILYRRRT